MNMIKIILASIVLMIISPLRAPEQEDITQEQTLIVNDEISQNQLKEWQEHMQNLLGKGMFWDFGNNVPTNDWKNTALELAQKTIEQDSSLVDEIKTSFVTTINDKIALENGIHSLFTTNLIAEFNHQIDEWLELKMDTIENNKKIIQETPQAIQTVEETVISTIENIPAPRLSTTVADEDQESKEQIIAQKEWSDYLENIAQQEYDSSNIDEFINKAHKLAQETVSPAQSSEQKNHIDTLKNEFKDAIEQQSKTKGFGGINPDTIIAEFNKKLDESIVQQPIEHDDQSLSAREQLMMSESSKNTPSTHMFNRESMAPNNQGAPIQTPPGSKKPAMESKPKSSEDIVSEYITVPYYEASHNQATFEREQEEIARQKALKEAVVGQIKQKAELDAEKKEKQTLIASLMEKIFNVDIDNWFKSNEKKPITATIPEIIETLLRAEPDPIKRTNKKNVYMQFQTTLLSFNNKEFWDSKNNRPLQSWVDKIKTELAILINYKMITVKQAIDIIDQTLQISSKIAERDKQAAKNSIKDFLETITQAPKTKE